MVDFAAVGESSAQLSLLPYLEPEARLLLSGELAAQLAARISAAPEAWPGVVLPAATFLAYLGRHPPQDPGSRSAWERWAVEELYLCCACVAGDASAVLAFEVRFLPAIQRALRRNRLPDVMVEELAQELRVRLLVGRPGEEGLLARYGGLGSLSGWLGVVAARAAREALHHEKRYVLPGDDRIADSLASEEPLVTTYREPFRRAVRQALADLEPRDLTLIRMRYVDGLTLKQMADTYRAHLTTVHRWIGAIQERLLAATRELMIADLGIDTEECESVLRMLQGHLDLTLTTLLGGQAPEELP